MGALRAHQENQVQELIKHIRLKGILYQEGDTSHVMATPQQPVT